MNRIKPKRTRLLPLFKRLMVYVKGNRIRFWMAVALLVPVMMLDVGIGVVQQVFVDTINQANLELLIRTTLICLGVAAVLLVALMAQDYLKATVLKRMAWRLRGDLFDRTNRLGFAELQKFHSGDLVSRNNKDAEQSMRAVDMTMFELFYNLMLCAVAFVYLAQMYLWLALLALGVGPVVFFSARFFDRKLRALSTRVLEEEAGLRGQLQEIVQGIQVVRAYGMEQRLLERYVTFRQALGRLQLRKRIIGGLLWQISGFVNGTVMVICGGLLALSAINGGASVGEVLAFIILMNRVQYPFVHMSQTWGGVQEAMGASERVFRIMDGTPESAGQPGASPEPFLPSKPALEVRGLRYTHGGEGGDREEGQGQALFDGLDFTVNHGETVAVVGPSGSGKSTLARLCCGLFEPMAGEIAVYGASLDGSREEARSRIAYVPQMPYLFAGTVLDNIRLGMESADMQQVTEAARLAAADGFIHALPNGYDTVLGEQGHGLSGGQRQRIAVARAFLKAAPLLIMDEATSALDNESEQALQKSLHMIGRERTVFVIAHRLSTVRNADRILVMDGGQIAEQGTHQELMERGGLYAELYRIQFQVQETAADPLPA